MAICGTFSVYGLGNCPAGIKPEALQLEQFSTCAFGLRELLLDRLIFQTEATCFHNEVALF
jgi:hypothetical protein